MSIAAGADLWETAKHAITAYTGLSPATFFTVLALAAAFYYAVSGLFAPPPPPPRRSREVDFEPSEPLPVPVQLGEITEEELSAYDGADPKRPLLMAIKGQIYDVTQSRMFYGPSGPYALFAGKDASRALAKMSFEQKDLTGDISGLGPFELEALQEWEYKFMSKYVKVGTVKRTVPVTDGSSVSAAETPAPASETVEIAPKDVPADVVAEAEHVVEPNEEGLAELGAGAEGTAESEAKDVEVKGVVAGESTKE